MAFSEKIYTKGFQELLKSQKLIYARIYRNVPWQISTFCFAYQYKHNANTNYDTTTNKKPGRVF